MKRILAIAFTFVLGYECSRSGHCAESISTVSLPAKSPIVNFRILFRTGSMDDPTGKEGLASLTAAMLSKAGTKTMSYNEIVEAMYPLATSLEWQADKEMTVFSGATHVNNLQRYYALIKPIPLNPGFRDEDFTRLKADAINFLKVTLRENNDEELGKEALYNVIYAGHPYGHQNLGTISGLEKITLDDVKRFYRDHFTRANLTIGLAGGFPMDFSATMQRDFAALPAGKSSHQKVFKPALKTGTEIEIIKRETRATAISIGFPISVRRGDKDWLALNLAAAWLGQHRSSVAHLYQRLRELRGLNYGDYSYIEYFPRGMYQFEPDPNLGRQQQIFQIWIRPVEPDKAHFALRAALFEFDQLVRDGISQEDFEVTREFMGKFSNILLQTADERLGYALDSKYSGIGEYGDYIRKGLAKLTRKDVNDAIRRDWKSDRMRIVIVSGQAEQLRDALASQKPSPITYNSPKPQSVLDEDKIIERYPIPVQSERIRIVPIESVFQRSLISNRTTTL